MAPEQDANSKHRMQYQWEQSKLIEQLYNRTSFLVGPPLNNVPIYNVTSHKLGQRLIYEKNPKVHMFDRLAMPTVDVQKVEIAPTDDYLLLGC